MDTLQFNLHQLILSDLARSVGPEDDGESTTNAVEAIFSRVQTRADNPQPTSERVEMSASRVECNIAFAELAVNVSEDRVDATVAVLVEILGDIPHISFPKSHTWNEWALPDQLVFKTVSSLLWLGATFSEYRDTITNSIIALAGEIVSSFKSNSALQVLTEVGPCFHGFYRAITSSPFPWSITDWKTLSSITSELYGVGIVDRLNGLLHEYLEQSDESPAHQDILFVQTLISRYLSNHRPLSGSFTVCGAMEIQWTVLAQVLVPPNLPSVLASSSAALYSRNDVPEAHAANISWAALMLRPVKNVDTLLGSQDIQSSVAEARREAMECFVDIMEQAAELDGNLDPEIYAYETLAESLKLSTLCSVALDDLDSSLYERIKVLLSEASPLFDSHLQDAALKSVNVLAQNFPEVASPMAHHLRRFISAPILTFYFESSPSGGQGRAPIPLVAAARSLALCIQLAPGNDLGLSFMYSLFNFISGQGHDTTHIGHENGVGRSPYVGDSDPHASVLDGSYDDEDRKLVGVSAVYVITRLALDLKSEAITHLAISMLLQRLRNTELVFEAAIAFNLIDLVLSASPPISLGTFSDIAKSFSAASLANLTSDTPSERNRMILAAQSKLAHELRGRPEHQELYLRELLSLFNDTGIAIQTALSKKGRHHQATSEQLLHLSSLVLPIDAALENAHSDFNADQKPELITLFQSFWFVIAVFRLSDINSTSSGLTDGDDSLALKKAALSRIAAKTPGLVTEESHDYLSSAVEYNRALRKDYVEIIASNHRAILTKQITHRTAEIRHLTPAQVVFLLAMHDAEQLRVGLSCPSQLPSYFVNTVVNQDVNLIACMEAIAQNAMRGCIGNIRIKVIDHAIGEDINQELISLLVWSCHRIPHSRETAAKYLDRLLTAFPSLMCSSDLVFAILEVLTLLQDACEGEHTDEFNPQHTFHSERINITLLLTDSYNTRHEILNQLYKNAQNWFSLAISRAPMEVQAILQKYLSDHNSIPLPHVTELGASVALKFATDLGTFRNRHAASVSTHLWKPDRAKVFASQMSSHAHYTGEAAGVRLANRQGPADIQKTPPEHAPDFEIDVLKSKMAQALREIQDKTSQLTARDLRRLLFRCASILMSLTNTDHDLLHYLVAVPFESLTPASIATGTESWTWLIRERPDLEIRLMLEINSAWLSTIELRKGMFSSSMDSRDPFYQPVEYSPTDKELIERSLQAARRLLVPHTILLQTLTSRFQSVRYGRAPLMRLLLRLVIRSTQAHKRMSTHPLAREARFTLLLFGFQALRNSRMDMMSELRIRSALYAAAFSWFSVRPEWTYGANRIQIDVDVKLLRDFLEALKNDLQRADHVVSSMDTPHLSVTDVSHKEQNRLLRVLVENEISRLLVWGNPGNEPSRSQDHPSADASIPLDGWTKLVRTAWQMNPAVAVHMAERFKIPQTQQEVTRLVRSEPAAVRDVPEALRILLGDKSDPSLQAKMKHVLLWAPVPPVLAVTYFQPQFGNDPSLLQYAHRVLEGHPVDVTFFFVPQIVQALRNDALGYVERFIFETTKISQLFCHQIIWNMKANTYKDDMAEVPDPMKPMLDRMTNMVVASLSGEAREFYDREFTFFEEVTSISGKLKPFIKGTKAEKKAKIDEEMAKIKVDVGVYLPSNPDGQVVDIDKRSGRPLQSHAKAPFMATFKVRKERLVVEENPDSVLEDNVHLERGGAVTHYDVWQQAIFKVGDDCRQDVLALQIIAMFKNTFTRVGLTLYLFPYRVTATAPGCGVIDVVPNATSRDEMGRQKVNDLLGFFQAKYGHVDSVPFQRARLNFIQSMAAYSVACYILQIKDRHNGNIMIDGEGHIVHIDFGFLFDIDKSFTLALNSSSYLLCFLCFAYIYAPEYDSFRHYCCGVKFEPSSFKLNHEMVMLMGGRYSEGYSLFVRLTVKAFLAIRPHTDQLVETVRLMLGTGLPSFKGEPTIQRLRDRFAPGLGERQAAEFMMGIVKNAHENVRSTVYDEFQRLQNGIPYA